MTKLQDDFDFMLINTRFPHLGKRIEMFWGSNDFDSMINAIMSDTRGGTRQGFPDGVGSAIFRLQQKHDHLFPNATPDLWERSLRNI